MDGLVVVIIVIVAGTILSFALSFARSFVGTSCPKCGKKRALVEISRKTVETYETTMDVEQDIRNEYGERKGSYVQSVPATKYIYECVDECKYCGYQTKVRRQETRRD